MIHNSRHGNKKEKSWFVLQRHGTTCFGHTGLRCSEGSDPRQAFSHISSPLHLVFFPGDISHILYDALGIFPGLYITITLCIALT